jgi:uncharacterized protein DUF4190
MTSQPPPDPYGQPQQQPDPYGQPQQSDPYGQPQQPDPYGQSAPPPASAPQYPQQPGQYPPPGQYPQPGQQYGQQYAGQPGYAAPAQGSNTNTMAIISLVLSLAGLATFLSAPVGAILGHVAKKQIAERGEQGEGMAMAGIIIGWVVTGLYALGCCGIIVLAATADTA